MFGFVPELDSLQVLCTTTCGAFVSNFEDLYRSSPRPDSASDVDISANAVQRELLRVRVSAADPGPDGPRIPLHSGAQGGRRFVFSDWLLEYGLRASLPQFLRARLLEGFRISKLQRRSPAPGQDSSHGSDAVAVATLDPASAGAVGEAGGRGGGGTAPGGSPDSSDASFLELVLQWHPSVTIVCFVRPIFGDGGRLRKLSVGYRCFAQVEFVA
ncbi:MAG TPA: hypothetical protein VJB16_03800, partial [archaeon]|nr:hypothetical protein [archaeon]